MAWLPSIITPSPVRAASPVIPPIVLSLATGCMIKLLLFCIFMTLALLVIIYICNVTFTLITITIAAVLQSSAIHLTFRGIIAL